MTRAAVLARIEELLKVEREATPGPWSNQWLYGALRHINKNVDDDAFYSEDNDPEKDYGRPNPRAYPSDPALIVAARNSFRGMLELAKEQVESYGEYDSATIGAVARWSEILGGGTE